jgi:hypothetical protein
MIFTQSNDLPPNPAVRIFFTGLLVLEPLPDKTCQVFVHNSSGGHNLLVEVRRKRPGKPDVVMMRLPGPLALTGGHPSNNHGLLIRTTNVPPAQKSVKAYNGNNPSAEGTELSDSFVLSRVLDVPPGPVDPVGGRPSILIDDGIFYTAEVRTINAELRKEGRPTGTALTAVPTIIGANIYLNQPAQKVDVRWRLQGNDVSLKLEKSPDFTYEIYINNELFYEDDFAPGPAHDEFAEYFKLLPAVPEGERFSLTFTDAVPDPQRGSSRSPCMSVVLTE